MIKLFFLLLISAPALSQQVNYPVTPQDIPFVNAVELWVNGNNGEYGLFTTPQQVMNVDAYVTLQSMGGLPDYILPGGDSYPEQLSIYLELVEYPEYQVPGFVSVQNPIPGGPFAVTQAPEIGLNSAAAMLLIGTLLVVKGRKVT